MSADFWAGYLSGAVGILIGNPLDLIKTRLQAGSTASNQEERTSLRNFRSNFDRAGTLVRGTTAPILGYGALNAILFVTYNRTLTLFGDDPTIPNNLWKVWCAGAVGGLATFVISAPTELVKCRAQVSAIATSSWSIARDTWKQEGIRGLYYGGCITSVRDAVGYGFYFWSYELTVKVLFCGGLAGVVTWASIFPLDVVKTRVQTQVVDALSSIAPEEQRLLRSDSEPVKLGIVKRQGAFQIARQSYRNEGIAVFFRGLGVCSTRAFVVNAVQWATYEWMMRLLR